MVDLGGKAEASGAKGNSGPVARPKAEKRFGKSRLGVSVNYEFRIGELRGINSGDLLYLIFCIFVCSKSILKEHFIQLS